MPQIRIYALYGNCVAFALCIASMLARIDNVNITSPPVATILFVYDALYSTRRLVKLGVKAYDLPTYYRHVRIKG